MMLRTIPIILITTLLYACNESESVPGGVHIPSNNDNTSSPNTQTQDGIDTTSTHDLAFEMTGTPSASLTAGDDLFIDYTLSNNGDMIDNGIAIYGVLSHISSASPTQGSSYLLGTVLSVSAGAVVSDTLSFTVPSSLATGEYQLHVYATSQRVENNLTNNSQTHNFSITGFGTCNSDIYEDNDSVETATDFPINSSQSHNFCYEVSDWVRIAAVAGTTYGVTTAWTADTGGPGIYIYAPDGETSVASSLGFGSTAPRLTWTAETSDFYYIKFSPYSGMSSGGVNSDYTISIGEPQADLYISSFYGSYNTLPVGGMSSLSFEVTNQGFAESLSSNAGIYLSTDAIIESTDTLISTINTNGIIDGNTEYVSDTFSIPSNIAPGNYYLGIIINPDQSTPEFDFTNNQSTSTPVILETPICSVDPWEDDDQITSANTISIGETQNRNHCEDYSDWISFNAVSGSSYSIRIEGIGGSSDSILYIYDTDGTTLLANQGSNFGNLTYSWVAPSTGTFYFDIQSYGGNIGSNRDYSIKVNDTMPDLVVNNLSFFVDDTSGNWVSGGLFEVGTSISNSGYLESGDIEVGIYLSIDSIVDTTDMKIHTLNLSNLAPGGYGVIYTSNNFAPIPSNLTAGTWYIAAIADDTNIISELDETNNISQVSAISVIDPLCTPDALEPNDFYNDATPLALGDVFSGLNRCDDSADWFSFNATSGGSYIIRELANLMGGIDDITVFDADGTTIYDDSESINPRQNHWLANRTGTYYIRVGKSESFLGDASNMNSYDITIDQCDLDIYEPNSSLATPQPISIGETQQHNFCDNSMDVASFTATAGVTYTIQTTHTGANVDSNIYLYDSAGGIETSDTSFNAPANITWVAPADGVYTIRVTTQFDWGMDSGYTLTITSP